MLRLDSMHFLTGEELSQTQLISLIDSAELLHRHRGGKVLKPLKNKTVALIFDKPSLRTRVSFTVGVQELGGQVMELVGSQTKSEDPEDTIRVLQSMVQGVVWRTFCHRNLERMASKATIPVINSLSDSHHPCQALADLLTLKQRFGRLEGLKLAYIGDGNNVLHSLLLLAPFAGVEVRYACPADYQPEPQILARAKKRALKVGASIVACETPAEAAQGAHALYTDVWTSMGFESEDKTRLEIFKDYQINAELLAEAESNAIIMHCMPMVKGREITAEMVEHPRSAIFQQAENRLHAQKALLTGLFQAQHHILSKEAALSHVI